MTEEPNHPVTKPGGNLLGVEPTLKVQRNSTTPVLLTSVLPVKDQGASGTYGAHTLAINLDWVIKEHIRALPTKQISSK